MRALLGEGGDFEDVLMRLGIGQSMLMLPVCIHGLHVFNCDRLERQREDIAGIPTLSQYLAKDFCHLVELMLFAAVWTGASIGLMSFDVLCFLFSPLLSSPLLSSPSNFNVHRQTAGDVGEVKRPTGFRRLRAVFPLGHLPLVDA